ncbi:NUDIX domain-containing protein [Niabella yanshanensis]|uniref:NUDIX domain-containing protein n=1 Tax=Niabella yanshanensis TaxID=577386 RepID=A0ABZ0W3I5_9BACT|nr:NUDIX domain-containing protein [Niabella yanshanensis]WQD37838.1 NUDIX domain-containing protein [Niabella yanshanensis]
MKMSAGILLFKIQKDEYYFFLVHPGGPFWKNKDAGAWSIPKGEIEAHEDALERARTEFKEETGKEIDGDFISLTPVRQKSGKWVQAWAVKGDIVTGDCTSNLFSLEWPPRSGKHIQVPEVDRWAWFSQEEAQQKINPAQLPFLQELINRQ